MGQFFPGFLPGQAVQVQFRLDHPAALAQVGKEAARQAGAQEGIFDAHFQPVFEGEGPQQGFRQGGRVILAALQGLRPGFGQVQFRPVRRGQGAHPVHGGTEQFLIPGRKGAGSRVAGFAGRPGRVLGESGQGVERGVQGAPPGALRLPSLRPEQELAALPEAPLMPFDPTGRFAQAVPFGLQEYLELVDATGRAVHPHKRGSIPAPTPAVLQRLGMDAAAFISAADTFFRSFASAVGTPAQLLQWAAHRQQRAMRGMAGE